MTHQQLIKLESMKGFEEAKDFIREGISFRLSKFETEEEGVSYKINTKPRESYYLPDIAVADVEHEEATGNNPMQKLLNKALR